MAAPPPPPKGGGMSLYANLLNPKAADSSASISSAPVLYENGDKEDSSKKEVNPALRFQPIRRPQANQKKPAKPGFPKAIPTPAAAATAAAPNSSGATPASERASSAAAAAAAAGGRSTLADWAATEDDEYLWGTGEKRQRGGRKKRNKRQQQQQQSHGRETDWDEIYDPARPTNVDEYLRSDERIREVQEWKAVLYAHRKRRRASYPDTSDDEDDAEARSGLGNQFAPPAEYSFAPPPMSPPPPTRDSPAAAGAAAPTVPDDATGDDAYARRLALSGVAAAPTSTTPPPPPPPEGEGKNGTTISRGPVRYEAPPQPPSSNNNNNNNNDIEDTMDLDDDDDVEDVDLPPSLGLGASSTGSPAPADGGGSSSTNRPGQKGFAQRLMSKYGWTAGSGLGASESGIVNPLSVKVERRKKRPDAEGGGFAEPGGRGRIVGGKTAATASSSSAAAATAQDDGHGKFGAMSEVIVLRNMLEGMDNLQGEINDGLGQEIGEECGDKYGRVERLYIDVDGRQVFIKFTDAVSALRAVNALEGRVFNGNAIAARFWDSDRFEKGEYS